MIEQNYFKNGKIDQAALVNFIKEIKKNTSLSDEDAAIIAASKVMISSGIHCAMMPCLLQVVDSQPKSKMWYRINATRNMTGGRKIQPTKMNDKLKEVSVSGPIFDHWLER
jgi:hypothetical protein